METDALQAAIDAINSLFDSIPDAELDEMLNKANYSYWLSFGPHCATGYSVNNLTLQLTPSSRRALPYRDHTGYASLSPLESSTTFLNAA